MLIDIPALRGVEWMEPGEPVLPEDLEAAEARQGVRVEPGLPWLRERDVAYIGSDVATDVMPSGYPVCTTRCTCSGWSRWGCG